MRHDRALVEQATNQGVVMNRVADHEHQLAADCGRRDENGAVRIDLSLDMDRHVEESPIKPKQIGLEIEDGVKGGVPAYFNRSTACAPIVCAHAGTSGGHERVDMVETMAHVTADPSAGTAACRSDITLVVDGLNHRAHLPEQTEQ